VAPPIKEDMLVNPEKQFLFFKPLKYAGTSVEHALLMSSGPDALCPGSLDGFDNVEYEERNNTFVVDGEPHLRFAQHTYPEMFFSRIGNPDFFKGFYKISMVRNPWSALVSYYWWCVRSPDYFPSEHVELISDGDSKRDVQMKFEKLLTMASSYVHEPIAESMGFDKDIASPLIFFLETNKRFFVDVIDYYIKFENIENDFTDLCNKLNIERQQLPRHKSNLKKANFHYSDYYSDWVKRQVKDSFYDLIKQYDYSFNGE